MFSCLILALYYIIILSWFFSFNFNLATTLMMFLSFAYKYILYFVYILYIFVSSFFVGQHQDVCIILTYLLVNRINIEFYSSWKSFLSCRKCARVRTLKILQIR